ncbi:MAG: hypothetical protein ACM3JG_10535 [Thiohalocapsa sp.]
MIGNGPSILVVDDDVEEGASIVSLLREAGFGVIAEETADGALAALEEQHFAAVVVAMRQGEGLPLLQRARRRQPGLKALVVIEPAFMRLVTDDCATLVKRPFDPRQLLGCVFALVLREDEQGCSRGHTEAEFGIAAAKLVCLQNRRVAAAAAGASRLAQELTRQIGETAARQRRLAAVQ